MVNLIVKNLKAAYPAPGEGGLGWLTDLWNRCWCAAGDLTRVAGLTLLGVPVVKTRTHHGDWQTQVLGTPVPTCRDAGCGSMRVVAALGTEPPRVIPRDWSFLTVHGFVPWPTPKARLLTQRQNGRTPVNGAWSIGV